MMHSILANGKHSDSLTFMLNNQFKQKFHNPLFFLAKLMLADPGADLERNIMMLFTNQKDSIGENCAQSLE